MSVVDSSSATIAFLYTADIERCLGWYGSMLGMHCEERDAYGAWLASRGARVRVTALPDFTPTEHPVVGWQVPDLVETAAELRGKGVSFTIYEGLGQDPNGIWTSPDGEERLAWLSDPDRNVLMLAETKS